MVKPRKFVKRANAICVTLYSPHQDEIDPKVLEEAVELLAQLAKDNGLFINTATA